MPPTSADLGASASHRLLSRFLNASINALYRASPKGPSNSIVCTFGAHIAIK